jgi:hypothetical protein
MSLPRRHRVRLARHRVLGEVGLEFYGRFCTVVKILDYICRVNLLREERYVWF